jgi:hypothetical protein
MEKSLLNLSGNPAGHVMLILRTKTLFDAVELKSIQEGRSTDYWDLIERRVHSKAIR